MTSVFDRIPSRSTPSSAAIRSSSSSAPVRRSTSKPASPRIVEARECGFSRRSAFTGPASQHPRAGRPPRPLGGCGNNVAMVAAIPSPLRLAVLDDYQDVALSVADWSRAGRPGRRHRAQPAPRRRGRRGGRAPGLRRGGGDARAHRVPQVGAGAAPGPPPAGDDRHAQRRDRPRRGPRPRHPGLRHRPGCAVRRGRAHLGAADGGRQAARRGDRQRARRRLDDHARHVPGRPHPRRGGAGPAGRPGGGLRARVRDGRRGVEPEPHRRALRRGRRPPCCVARRPARRVGLRLAAPGARRAVPRHHRSARSWP